MRPTRLEIAGFTAFRELTVVEFGDTDVFALVGPTGSGKSSLIDAMIFTLYGIVPRYQNANLIAPAISQGRNEARVRLDFVVGGKRYSAVRVVRRTKAGGATTKEARLECDDEILAADAKGLTDQIERIIGLTFEQFTTCVVLPQGAFAKFLNDKPSDRQNLLVKLLGLGLYERIREDASSRAAEARSRIAVHDEELSTLAEVTKDTEKEAKASLKAIDAAQKSYRKDFTRIGELEKQCEKLDELAEKAASDLESLAKLKIPKAVKELATERLQRQKALANAEAAQKALSAKLAADEEARTALGEAAPLVEARQRHADLTNARKSDTAARERVALQVPVVSAAEKAEAAAKEAVAAALSARERMQQIHLAHALSQTLVVGAPCPVCGNDVDEIPKIKLSKDLEKTKDAIAKAEAALEREGSSLQKARATLARAEAELASVQKQIIVLEKQLKSAPSVADLQARLTSIESLETKLKATRKQANEASAPAKARRSLDGLSKEEEGAWAQFGDARDGLAHLKPPAAKATDLAGSWQTLVAWGATQVPLVAQRKADAEADSKRIENEREALIDKHIEELTELGYEIDVDESVNDQIAQFVADARATLKQITGQLNRKGELETLVGTARQQARTAEALALHLKADRFERWLLEAAFERLVAGASEVLQGLSSGAYSFAYNKKLEFEVVDHANADETRSARTLSGGETFLASLALALTLADQVGDLAVEGAARLESMFLDEGFGSLDLDTLEVVATAIEELGSRGRMFGLVTHVPELAERVQVQYRVTKGPATSTVERVAI